MSFKIIFSGLLFGVMPAFSTEILGNAAMVELNKEGLELLSAEIERTALADIKEEVLPDQETEASGVDITMEGIKYSAKFKNLRLSASVRGLSASLLVSDVAVDIDRIKMKKRILGATLRTTCSDTKVKVGHNEGAVINSTVRLDVVGNSLTVDVDGSKFGIDKDSYEIHGPRSCTGDLGMGYLIKGVVRVILDNARSRIEEAVAERVNSLSDVIAERLNEVTHRVVPIVLKDNPLLRGSDLVLNTFPSRVELADGRLRFELGADVKGLPLLKKEKRFASSKGALKRVGSVGINPALLTELMQIAMVQQDQEIRLDPSGAPGLSEILNQTSASSLWPDLSTRVIDGQQLQLGVKMTEAPVFQMDPAENRILFSVKNIELSFYIKQSDEEKHYFTIFVDISSYVGTTVRGSLASIVFIEPPKLVIRGEWGEGINPSPEIFEADVAQVLLSSVFEYLYASGSIFAFKVPDLSFGGAPLKPSAVAISDNFLELILVRD